MTSANTQAHMIDAKGRRPHLPLDHRHSGYSPRREDLDKLINSAVIPNAAHLEAASQQLLRIGKRFGIALDSVAFISRHVRVILTTAYLSDVLEKTTENLLRGQNSEVSKYFEPYIAMQKNIVDTCNGMIDTLHAMVEREAVANHRKWMIQIIGENRVEGLQQAIARTKLSLEDLTFDAEHGLSDLIAQMEKALSDITRGNA